MNKNGEKHGKGLYHWSSSDQMFVGYWEHDIREKYGKIIQGDHINYEGGWLNGNWHGQGSYYYANGDYDKAVSYYQRLFEREGNKFTFNRYFECLVKTENFKEAEKILKKQIAADRTNYEYKVMLGEFYEQTKNETGLVQAYNNLGVVFSDLGLYDSALINHRKALLINRNLQDQQSLSLSYSNLARLYYSTKKTDSTMPST
jgi:tetratricopeptide (TPR) repeat protein